MGLWQAVTQGVRDWCEEWHAASIGYAIAEEVHNAGEDQLWETSDVLDVAQEQGIDIDNEALVDKVLEGFEEGVKQAASDALPWYQQLTFW